MLDWSYERMENSGTVWSGMIKMPCSGNTTQSTPVRQMKQQSRRRPGLTAQHCWWNRPMAKYWLQDIATMQKRAVILWRCLGRFADVLATENDAWLHWPGNSRWYFFPPQPPRHWLRRPYAARWMRAQTSNFPNPTNQYYPTALIHNTKAPPLLIDSFDDQPEDRTRHRCGNTRALHYMLILHGWSSAQVKRFQGTIHSMTTIHDGKLTTCRDRSRWRSGWRVSFHGGVITSFGGNSDPEMREKAYGLFDKLDSAS